MYRSSCIDRRVPMKRKAGADGDRPKTSSSQSASSITDLRAELTAAARGSKASIARVLSVLKARGELVDDRLGGNREQCHLQEATTKHGNAITPYGTVTQRVKLTDDYFMEYVHPCAYFFYLSSICERFSKLINDLLDTVGAQPLNVIVYGDEMTPGNPLRPDDGREAWQWSFSIVEFPSHLLRSHAGWVHITTLRSSVLGDLTGGVPTLAKSILNIMFLGVHNLADGFYVNRPDGSMRRSVQSVWAFWQTRRDLNSSFVSNVPAGSNVAHLV